MAVSTARDPEGFPGIPVVFGFRRAEQGDGAFGFEIPAFGAAAEGAAPAGIGSEKTPAADGENEKGRPRHAPEQGKLPNTTTSAL